LMMNLLLIKLDKKPARKCLKDSL